jgi:hypothetical protein
MRTNDVSSGFGESETYTSHDITTLEPPDVVYTFPLTVSDKWESRTNMTTKSTYTYDGEAETDVYTETKVTKNECLRTETVTVPAGTFQTFVVYHETVYEDLSNDDYEEYYDSDNDGWDDYEESYYGTDPEDPEEYPYSDPSDEKYNDTDNDGWQNYEEEYYGTDPEDPEDYPEGDGSYEEEKVMESEVSSSGLYSEGYTVEYYSPELGYLAKIEEYDYSGVLILSIELEEYNYAGKTFSAVQDNQSTGDFGFRLPMYFLIISILIILILLTVGFLAIRRKKRQRLVIQAQQSDPRYSQPAPSQSIVQSESSSSVSSTTLPQQQVVFQEINDQNYVKSPRPITANQPINTYSATSDTQQNSIPIKANAQVTTSTQITHVTRSVSTAPTITKSMNIQPIQQQVSYPTQPKANQQQSGSKQTQVTKQIPQKK